MKKRRKRRISANWIRHEMMKKKPTIANEQWLRHCWTDRRIDSFSLRKKKLNNKCFEGTSMNDNEKEVVVTCFVCKLRFYCCGLNSVWHLKLHIFLVVEFVCNCKLKKKKLQKKDRKKEWVCCATKYFHAEWLNYWWNWS